MKNKTTKFLIIMLVFICCFTVVFVACHKYDIPPIPREDRVDGFVSTVLSAKNSAWKTDMEDSEVVDLATPGEYVVANHWAKFAGKVIFESNLQDGKIQTITNYFESEKGKTFLANEFLDLNALFGFLGEIGLTTGDVESLVYEGLRLFIGEGLSVFENALLQLNRVNKNGTLSLEKLAEINSKIEQMTFGKDGWTISAQKAESALTALEQAENGIKNLVSFTYQAAMIFGNGSNSGLFSALNNGSLTDATAGEIATYLTSVFDTFDEFESTLSETNLSEISSAVEEITGFIESVTTANNNMQMLSMVLKNGVIISSALPFVCQLLDNLEEVALDGDGAFINGIMTALSGEYISNELNANEIIAYSRLVLGALGIDYTLEGADLESAKANAKNLLDGLANKIELGSTTYKDKMPLVYFAFMLNAESEEEYMGTVKLSRVGELCVTSIYFDQFKKNYNEYKAGLATSTNPLTNTATVLLKYVTGEQNVTVGSTFDHVWFESVCQQVEDKFKEETEACFPSSMGELKKWLNTFTGDCLDKILTMASSDPVKTTDVEEFNALAQKIYTLYSEVITALVG